MDQLANQVGGGAHVDTRRISVLKKTRRISLYLCLVSIGDADMAKILKPQRQLIVFHLTNCMKLVAVLDGDFSKGL